MTTDNFCFYLQNRLIQTSQLEVNGSVILPCLVFPGVRVVNYAFTSADTALARVREVLLKGKAQYN
jgi:hypothetical protein